MEKEKIMAYKAKFCGDVANCEIAYRLWQFEKNSKEKLGDQPNIPDTIGNNEIIIIEADLMVGLISGVVLGEPKYDVISKDQFINMVASYRQNNINMNLLAAMDQYSPGHLNDIFTYKALWFAKKKSGPIARVSHIMKFYNEDDAIYKYLDKDGGISNEPDLDIEDVDMFELMGQAFTRAMKEPDICKSMNSEIMKEHNIVYNPETDNFEEVSPEQMFGNFLSGLFSSSDDE